MRIQRKKIVIVGAGPAGIGAAIRLHRAGFKDILLLDRFRRIGGIASKYRHRDVPTFILWSKGKVAHGCDYARRLAKRLESISAEIRLETTVLALSISAKTLTAVSPDRGCYKVAAEAIVLACGAREKNLMERGWLFGDRPVRLYNSFQVLEFMNCAADIQPARFQIVGSEPLSYAMAAKLAHTEIAAQTPGLIDHQSNCSRSLASRIYFGCWTRPGRSFCASEANIRGNRHMEAIDLKQDQLRTRPTDYVVMTGSLAPNTELLAAAGLRFESGTRNITPQAIARVNRKGIFSMGNMTGSSHGGERAYWDGFIHAGKVLKFLKTGTSK